MNNKQRIQRRRLIATFMVFAYMVPDLLPGFISIAAPQVFVHPGAGVSSLPLNVSNFNAAGFGDLADAVNLANGNVFLGTDNLSYNNKLATGDESTNTIGGSGWNLTQRLRLNGFNKSSNANFGLTNLATESNPASNYYSGYFAKPNVYPFYRLSSQDSPGQAGTCGNNYTSGFIRNEATPYALNALPVGKYRLVFSGRADANLGILYGLDDAVAGHFTGGTLTPSWQTYTGDYTIAATDGLRSRLITIYESTQNNPGWDIANVSLQALNASNVPTGPNLLTTQDITNSYYQPICAKPTVESAYQMQSTDAGGVGGNRSGIYHIENNPLPAAGRYRVSLDARTRNGTLNLIYGANDSLTTTAALTTNWQSFSTEYNVPANGQDRFIEVFENTAANPDWEIKNLKVQRISPGSFTISRGEGSATTFFQHNLTAGELVPGNVPHWLQRYAGVVADTAFYETTPAYGKQYSREWIVLRRVGTNNMIAHYYDAAGNRTTFHNDGEYADYTQNVSQQYRGANLATTDPEGESTITTPTTSVTPKTEFTYTDYNSSTGLSTSGLISKIKDEWGRVNAYTWNTNDKTLSSIYQLVQDDSTQPLIESTWQRKTEYTYIVGFGQRLLRSINEWAYDGKSATTTIQRNKTFSYMQTTAGAPVTLTSINRSILGGQGTNTTLYTYDAQYRVIKVEQVNGVNFGSPATEPATTYTYGMTGTVAYQNPSQPVLKLEPSSTNVMNAVKVQPNLEQSKPHLNPKELKNTKLVNPSFNQQFETVLQPERALQKKPMGGLGNLNSSQAYSTAKYVLPKNLHTDMYSIQVVAQQPQAHQVSNVIWKYKGTLEQPAQAILVGAQAKGVPIGQKMLRPGEILEFRTSNTNMQFKKLVLTPIIMSATAPTSTVKVVQASSIGGSGDSSDAARKQQNYYFDKDGQLVKKEVWKDNSFAGPGVTFATTGYYITTQYDYVSMGGPGQGSTSSVMNVNTGRKDTMEYNYNGALVATKTFAGTDYTNAIMRTTTFGRDHEGNLVSQTTTGMTGTGYSYLSTGVVNTICIGQPNVTCSIAKITKANQTFQMISSVKSETQINGVTQYTNTSTFDDSGRIIKTERTATGIPTQTVDYTYNAKNVTFINYIPNTLGNAVNGSTILQYADQPYSMTKFGDPDGARFRYDAFGHVIHERLMGKFKTDVNSTDADHYKWYFRSYNGFGQQIWDTIYSSVDGNSGIYTNIKINTYYNTGELDSSWAGTSSNVTDYTYLPNGRMAGIRKGAGSAGGVPDAGLHEQTVFAYDAFGRISSKTTDTSFLTTYTYDTQDNQVGETRPDNGYSLWTYGAGGHLYSEGIFDPKIGDAGTADIAKYYGKVYTRDSLGRVTGTTFGRFASSTPDIVSSYDSFDRPIKVVDNRLEMNTAGDDRATFLNYDSMGRLVKKLDPVLRSAAGGILDSRRPYTELSYDILGRKTKENKLLEGSIAPGTVIAAASTPASSLMGSLRTAVSTVGDGTTAGSGYDTWDRVTQTIDSDGYTTDLEYDGLGNITRKSVLVCKSGVADCTNNFVDGDSDTTDRKATTQYRYDAAGRVTKTIDANGGVSRVRYNALGNVLAQSDARLITTKAFGYTEDGLLSWVAEPDNLTTTPQTNYIDTLDLTGYVKTKTFQYQGYRKFPTGMYSAYQDIPAGQSGSAYTTYDVYDWAGRPKQTTLPDRSSTITQTYDARGNVISMKDAEGFVTDYAFNIKNKLVTETKKRRAGTIDMTALPGDLVSTYEYDLAGNLTQKRERGLVTRYAYNSLGKDSVETRAYKPTDGAWASPGDSYKWKAYRLDGERVAESTFGAPGTAFESAVGFNYAGYNASLPATPAAGNITMYRLIGSKSIRLATVFKNSGRNILPMVWECGSNANSPVMPTFTPASSKQLVVQRFYQPMTHGGSTTPLGSCSRIGIFTLVMPPNTTVFRIGILPATKKSTALRT
jgi:YD repeat-containing protein